MNKKFANILAQISVTWQPRNTDGVFGRALARAFKNTDTRMGAGNAGVVAKSARFKNTGTRMCFGNWCGG